MDQAARRARIAWLLLGLLLEVPLAAAARAPPHPAEPPRRVRVDIQRDPPWRLQLVPGIGPVRAGKIAALRGARNAAGTPLLVRALGARLAARIAGTPLVELHDGG